MGRPFYAIQPAFTGGEISEDVASRIDLNKYELALLQAENAIIKPYGSIRKRSGTKYCGTTKNNGKAILRRFEFTTNLSYLLEIGAGYIRIWKDGEYLNVELATPFTVEDLPNIRTVQSVDVIYICTGAHPVQKLMRYAEDNWQIQAVEWKLPPFGEINADETAKITPSGLTGTITLTANKNIFSADNVGDFIKITQRVPGETVKLKASPPEQGEPNYVTSAALTVGGSWKIITHGTWAGTVKIEQSEDGGTTWSEYRAYVGNSDYNPTESGTVDEKIKIRARAEITSGSVDIALSTYSYKNDGYAKITAYTSATVVTATTTKDMGTTTATADFYLSAWGKTNGYPYAVTFFQDRLCFGGCPRYPQRVWMSRTGDYENFEVEKEGGSVTDDSAVTADLLSLKSYKINHLCASNDLIVMTEGNTWTISGSETVTPSNITPRNQETYGANNVEPIKIGPRMVYVQQRGSSVRDVGYSYDSDSYNGVDLTLLAKHLVRDNILVDGAYTQEPDSCSFFVRDDGKIICLTYVPDQRVYAWSHMLTDGQYEAVASIVQGVNDYVYAVVKRTVNGAIRRYVERFDIEGHSEAQQDYHMLDAYVEYSGTATDTITGLAHLEGLKVQVLADGYYYDNQEYIVEDGRITLPEAVERAVVGLPYTLTIEQANFDAGNTDSGTLQGRNKRVSTAILRLVKSYGGSIGPNANAQNKIIYDPSRLEQRENRLYTGDKEVVLGTGGYDTKGRTYIIQNEPYPFVLSAIIREVTI